MTNWKFKTLQIVGSRITMRILFIVLIVASSVDPAQAQWATSSNDVYNTNSGNVAIRVSSGGARLAVCATSSCTSGNAIQVGNDVILADLDSANAMSINGTIDPTVSTIRLGTGGGTVSGSSGNIGIGTTTPAQKLDVTGHIRQSSSGDADFVSVNGNGKTWRTYNLYSNNHLMFWSDAAGGVVVFDMNPNGNVAIAGDVTVGGNISAKYQDLAEWVLASRLLEPGTVVIQDPDAVNSVISSNESYDTRVAGVISSNPGIILGVAGEGKVRVASTGRVKVRVDATYGAIRAGDLLVTIAREGTAMRSNPIDVSGITIHRPGTLIGKALEPLSEGEGEILVLLSLQ